MRAADGRRALRIAAFARQRYSSDTTIRSRGERRDTTKLARTYRRICGCARARERRLLDFAGSKRWGPPQSQPACEAPSLTSALQRPASGTREQNPIHWHAPPLILACLIWLYHARGLQASDGPAEPAKPVKARGRPVANETT